MNTIIKLSFPSDLTGLAGYRLGQQIFQDQVKDNISYNDKITLVFPNNIKRIASSFIQGFFDDIIKNIGLLGIEKYRNKSI